MTLLRCIRVFALWGGILIPAVLLSSALVCASPREKAAVIRVMSFNIRYDNPADGDNRWANRLPAVRRLLDELHPDVLGIQEGLPHQVDDLRRIHSGFASVGSGRDAGGGGERSAILFRDETFEKLRDGQFWLSGTPDVPGSRGWDAALPRIATWALLRHRPSGREILFLNTHFDHRGRRARVESARLIRGWLARWKEPVVVTGDFNVNANTASWRILTEADGSGRKFVDAWSAAPETTESPGTYHGFRGSGGKSRIDWILMRGALRPVTCRIITDRFEGRYPSDHFPVLAEIEWDR